MWMLWLIPAMSFGFAVAVFYERVMRQASPRILTARKTVLIPLVRPQTGSVPEKSVSRWADCWTLLQRVLRAARS